MLSGAGSHSTPNAVMGGSPSESDRGAATPSPASAPFSTPPSASTVALRPNELYTHGDVTPPSQPSASKKKKGGARAVGPDNNGWGLRQLSMRVREKVESKGRTTQNEVADELVAEFSARNVNIESIDSDNPSAQQNDDKNIRRRVYDALNVLLSMGIISKDKDKKEIQWKGLPMKKTNEIEDLKSKYTGLKDRIAKKNAYLQDLEDKYACLQNLVRRNKKLYGSGDAPSAGLAFPFVLIETDRHANVEMEILEDTDSIVHLDFNSTPFELWDEYTVMKAMGLSDKEKIDDTQAPVANHGECSGTPTNYRHQPLQPPGQRVVCVPEQPQIPGILKGHAKHGQ